MTERPECDHYAEYVAGCCLPGSHPEPTGSDMSRERAHSEDRDGTTALRQSQALRWLDRAHSNGVTWRELSRYTGWHHGQASGVLSVLHKVGKIERLAETRNRCHVYVMPEHVAGRETQPHGGRTDWKARALAAETQVAKVRARIAPQWRSLAYDRNALIDDLRADLGEEQQ